MKEVKTPKKPLLFYYAVALLVLFLFIMMINAALNYFLKRDKDK